MIQYRGVTHPDSSLRIHFGRGGRDWVTRQIERCALSIDFPKRRSQQLSDATYNKGSLPSMNCFSRIPSMSRTMHICWNYSTKRIAHHPKTWTELHLQDSALLSFAFARPLDRQTHSVHFGGITLHVSRGTLYDRSLPSMESNSPANQQASGNLCEYRSPPLQASTTPVAPKIEVWIVSLSPSTSLASLFPSPLFLSFSASQRHAKSTAHSYCGSIFGVITVSPYAHFLHPPYSPGSRTTRMEVVLASQCHLHDSDSASFQPQRDHPSLRCPPSDRMVYHGTEGSFR